MVWFIIIAVGAWVLINIIFDWVQLGRESRAQWARLMAPEAAVLPECAPARVARACEGRPTRPKPYNLASTRS